MKNFKLIVLALLVFLFYITACEKPKPLKNKYVALLPKSVSSLPLMIAIDEGVLKDAEISYEFFSNHPQALARLIRGDADFLYTGSTQGWENQISGGPLRMVSSGVWGMSFLMGKEVISNWGQLKNKKIVLPFLGSPLDYQTKALMAQAGINIEGDVEITYGPFAATIALLVSGKADFAPLPEPLVSRLELQGKLKRIFSYESSWGELTGSDGASPQVSLFVTKDFLSEDKIAVRSLLDKWQAANAHLLQNPEVFAAKYAHSLEFSEEEIINSIKNCHFEVVSPEENKKLSLKYMAELKKFIPDFHETLKDEFFYDGK
ncbi:MAG: ABC transporter substrate-binding protein [Spirochaetales bacterium]|nr:ABC transporter substrate-binding protein [Spirochaetales bacterium]